MFTALFLAPFVVRLSRYFGERGLVCQCRIEGHGAFIVGTGAPECTITFDSLRSFCLLAVHPHLMTFAWLYMNGHVDGDWMAFAQIVNRFSTKRPPPILEKLLARFQLSQKIHYGWSASAYACFLDVPFMQYTCGCLQGDEPVTLEESQLNKLRFISELLQPRSGERHLDSGCGWGGLIRHFTGVYGTFSDGITIAPEQAAYAREHVPSELARFFATSFEEFTPAEPYDFATVVGMLEHVPIARHPEFFRWLAERLRVGGRVYLQCITAACAPTDRVRLLKTYVFEHELNTIENILALARVAGFRVVNTEEAHQDYAFTTWEWVKRIRARKDEILGHLGGDERIYRTLLGYITLASLACAEERMHLHRVFLVKEW